MLNPKTGLRLVRPLLRCSRSDIERYARARELSWVEDESNLNLAIDRNFLRCAVLPRLTERYPGCRETLARAAENLGEAQRLLDQLAQTDAARAVQQDRLSLTRLRALEPARQRNLLRWFLRANGVAPPPRERLASALRQFLESRPDAQPHIELDHCSLRRYRGWLLVERGERTLPQRWALTWKGEPSLALPDGTSLRFVAAEGAGLSHARLLAGRVTVRTRNGGERLRVATNRPTRTLKNLLQEAGVPAWRRGSLPLLFVGDTLAWAPGVGADCNFGAQPGEPGVLIQWTGRCADPNQG
jgi:tRNA(Ile)-lysidine synthase